jgi:multidrug efflux system membrane fusion protein
VTLVPNPVIQRNADTAFVYLLNADQTVAVHPITSATTDGNVTEVGGLDAGAVVVADNFNRLTDGAKVTVRPSGGWGGKKDHQKSGNSDPSEKSEKSAP